MGMTMTQKILAAHCGEAAVTAGQLINAQLDIVLGNDITTPVAINEFEKAGFDSVFDRTRVNIVLDHFVPNKDIKSATQSKQCQLLFKHFHIHAVGKIHGFYFRITACQHFYIGSHTCGKAAMPGHNYTYNSKLHSFNKTGRTASVYWLTTSNSNFWVTPSRYSLLRSIGRSF